MYNNKYVEIIIDWFEIKLPLRKKKVVHYNIQSSKQQDEHCNSIIY